MPFPRASSGMLRAHIRPARTAAPFRSTQIRTQIGSEPPAPKRPAGGADALRRNWVPIGGGALAVLAAYAYFWRNPKEVRHAGEKFADETGVVKKT